MTTRTAQEEMVALDSPFAEFFRTLTGPWPFRPLLALTPGKHFIPTTDVYARNGSLVIKIDLPGMEPKDIHVKVFEGELTVSGERKVEAEVKEDRFYRKEAAYGFFERHMTVPKGIAEADIKAEYDNGVLEITMPREPKAEELPKAKEIPVKQATRPVKV